MVNRLCDCFRLSSSSATAPQVSWTGCGPGFVIVRLRVFSSLASSNKPDGTKKACVRLTPDCDALMWQTRSE
uniref:Uncharacterized protein n=1 Tax=Salix viminalis TaxID=40686 RepID=A0A6N2LG64_SALVM